MTREFTGAISGGRRDAIPRPDYRELKHAVQAALAADAALVDYVRVSPLSRCPERRSSTFAPPHYYATSLRASGRAEASGPGPASEIDSAVAQLRDDVQSAASAKVVRAAPPRSAGACSCSRDPTSLHGADHVYVVADDACSTPRSMRCRSAAR